MKTIIPSLSDLDHGVEAWVAVAQKARDEAEAVSPSVGWGATDAALALADWPLAQRIAGEVLELARRRFELFGKTAESTEDLSMSLRKAGEVAERLNKYARARELYEESLDLRRRSKDALEEKPEALRDLSALLEKVGTAARGDEDFERSREAYEESLEIARRLRVALGDTSGALGDLWASLVTVGDAAVWRHEYARAREAYEESLEIARALNEMLGESPEALRYYLVALEGKGYLAEHLGEYARAREAYEESLALCRRRLTALDETPEVLRDLWLLLDRLGRLAAQRGEYARARDAHEESLGHVRRLKEILGETPEVLLDLVVALIYSGRVDKIVGERGRARKKFEEASVLAERLVNCEPHDPSYKDLVQMSKEDLAGLIDQNKSILMTLKTMRYISTRGNSPAKTFTEILLAGLAPDGGLYLPEAYPQVTKAELAEWRELPYHALAFKVLSKFITDIPADDLKALVERTYTAAVYCNTRPGEPAGNAAAITPLRTLEPGLHILELSNGPTLAFKDMAMQLLGNLFEYALGKTGAELNILGATSGDTGSSAEYAMRGKRGIRVFMLSPHGKMSRFQTAQMFSLQDANIFNIAVRGVFDDCQDMVKAVSNDHAFKERYKIGTVNSINWARVAAQIVYYFKGYFAATKSNDEQVSFSVPSGNFGNICAGHIARMMGLPIRQLVLATNENDVLDEFFRTGAYRPRATAQTFHTSSPSMDISKASNFERFVYDLVGRDAATVRELWARVDAGGAFDLAGTPHFARLAEFGFVSGSSSHADRLATIRRVQEKYGVMIDTHTADGVKVALEHREAGVPMICLETALPCKFADTILEALGREPERPAAMEGIEKLPQRFEVMDASAQAIKDYVAQHAV